MREIKYRVWDKRTNQMKPVANISFGDDGSAQTIMAELAPKGEQYNAIVHGESGILMQFTGFKDCNGREIYEGDIARHPHWDAPHNLGAVTWSEWYPGFIIFTDKSTMVSAVTSDWEVIGNVYEHLQLLEPQP